MRSLFAAAGFMTLAAILGGPPLPAAAAPAAAPSPEATDEVVVTIWSFVSPGMVEKRGCRLRVGIENRTGGTIGFYGKFRSFLRDQEQDAWFVSAGNIPPGGNTERLYACVAMPDRLTLDDDSRFGYPQVCEVRGITVRPCPYTVRVVPHLKASKP